MGIMGEQLKQMLLKIDCKIWKLFQSWLVKALVSQSPTAHALFLCVSIVSLTAAQGCSALLWDFRSSWQIYRAVYTDVTGHVTIHSNSMAPILRYQATALLPIGKACWHRLLIYNFKNNGYKTYQKHPHETETPLYALKLFSLEICNFQLHRKSLK